MRIRNTAGILHGILLGAVTGLSVLSVAVPASAAVFSFVGSRYQAMGGAGVAVVDDGLAQYWNPGALGFMQGNGFQVPVGINYSIENQALSSLSRVLQAAEAADDALNSITGPLTEAQLQGLVGLVDEFAQFGTNGQTLQGDLNVALVGHHNRIGFGAISLTNANIRPIFDPTQGLAIGIAGAIDDVMDLACAGGCALPANTALSMQIASASAPWAVTPVVGGGTYADQLVATAEAAGVDTTNADNANLLSQIAVDTANAAGTLADNSAIGVDVQGLSTQEFGLSYGMPIPMPFFKPLDRKIAFGGVLKYMLGISYSKLVSYRNGDDAGAVISEALSFDNVVTSHNVGLDLGLMGQPYDWLRVGMVFRNVNGPTFDRNIDIPGQDSEFELQPQVRMGVAVIPFKNWIIASDLDLTENQSLDVPGFHSRIFSLGTEYTLPVSWAALAFRVGGYLNTSNVQNNDFAITAGLGMRFGEFVVELGAGSSFKTEEFSTGSNSTSSLPTRLNAGINLRWEDRPEGSRRTTGRFTTP